VKTATTKITVRPFSGGEGELKSFMTSVFGGCDYSEEIVKNASFFRAHLQIIEIDAVPVGFVVFRVVQGSRILRLDEDEDIDLAAHIEPDSWYVLVDYLEILESFQRQGIGSAVMNKIVCEAAHPIVLYSTGESQEFWMKSRFGSVGLSDWWMWNQ
jgi:GNAT superfamily N-acetyltransferase